MQRDANVETKTLRTMNGVIVGTVSALKTRRLLLRTYTVTIATIRYVATKSIGNSDNIVRGVAIIGRQRKEARVYWRC